MKKGLLLLVFALAVSGCAGLPSFSHCQKVSYVRDGVAVEIKASCAADVAF